MALVKVDSSSLPVMVTDSHALTDKDDECCGEKGEKLAYTFCIVFVYFVGGALKGQEGVSFLDLLIITDSDIDSGSLLLTCSALGYLLGPLMIGFLYDRYNNNAMIVLFIVTSGLVTFAIPWCTHLVLMAVVFVFRSLLNSGFDIGVIVITVRLWKEDVNPYMQALQAMFALGGIVAPLITAPFLLPSPIFVHAFNTSADPVDLLQNTSFLPITGHYHHNATWWDYNSTNSMTSHDDEGKQPIKLRETRVFIAYSIIGACMLVSAMPILVFWLRESSQTLSVPVTEEKVNVTEKVKPSAEEHEVTRSSSSRLLPLAIVLVGLFFFTYGPVEKACANFSVAFLVKYLEWSKTRAAQGNAAFYVGFAGGRFVGIALALVVRPTGMMLAFSVALLVNFALFVVAVGKSAIFVWVCLVITGVTMSTIYASMVAWVDMNVTSVTGKMASCIQVTLALGTIATTPLLGFLFKEVTPMWFLYLSIGCTATFLISFIGLYALTSKFHMKQRKLVLNIEEMSALKQNEDHTH